MSKKIRQRKKIRPRHLILALLSVPLLAAFIVTFYFLILIYIKPTSFPFINQAVENFINDKLTDPSGITINDAYISLEDFYKIKIDLRKTQFKLSSAEAVLLPRIEAELPIYKIFWLNFLPNEITVVEPEIIINQNNSQIAINGFEYENFTALYSQKLWDIFSGLSESWHIDRFIVEQGRVVLKKNEVTHNILIKNFDLGIKPQAKNLNLTIETKINFDQSSFDLGLEGDCLFQKNSGLKCDLSVVNLVPQQFADFADSLSGLAAIETRLGGNIGLEIDENRHFTALLFDFNAEKGSFYLPKIANQKIRFANFVLSGDLNKESASLNIDKLSTEFGKTKFEMTARISNFQDPQKQISNLQIKIAGVDNSNLNKLWPNFLDKNGIKKWLNEHMRDGLIHDGYANIKLVKKNGETELEDIQSELVFSDMTLEYGKHFPAITKINGIAAFNKKAMKIDLVSGQVLKSSIQTASVVIDDFHKPKIELKISGLVTGKADDLLNHIDYRDQNFTSKMANYFNGQARSSFEIKLPLSDEITLKNIGLFIQSEVSNLRNQYVPRSSNLLVSVNKKSGSNDFIGLIDLSQSEINLPNFSIKKSLGEKSKARVVLNFERDNQFRIKDFSWSAGQSLISGNLTLQNSPFVITHLELNNKNFGRNNFRLLYKADAESLSREVHISGNKFDLEPLLKTGLGSVESGERPYLENIVTIDLDSVYLQNNEKLRNVNVNVNCMVAVCNQSFIRSDVGTPQEINITLQRDQRGDQDSLIIGQINDVSILARGLDITDKLTKTGMTKIKGRLKELDKKMVLQGTLKINSGFSLIYNEVVEKVSQDEIFAKLKNKIRGGEKLNFENLEVEFRLFDNLLQVKSLIANSYLLGFTAKGEVDLNKSTINLKGLIVPGYSLNRLFGIGNIPLVGKVIIGEKGGGLFALRYQYRKEQNQDDGKFDINRASVIVPGAARNVFDLF